MTVRPRAVARIGRYCTHTTMPGKAFDDSCYTRSKGSSVVRISYGKGTTKLTPKKGTHKLHAVFLTTSTIASSTSSTVTVKIAK